MERRGGGVSWWLATGHWALGEKKRESTRDRGLNGFSHEKGDTLGF